MASLKFVIYVAFFTYLRFTVLASEVQINITADPGQNITLPCQTNIITTALVVEWTRCDLRPEYVFLYRDKKSDSELQHPSFMNRVQLEDREMKGGDVSLILRSVTRNDTGTYKCRVILAGTNYGTRTGVNTEPISIVNLKIQQSDPQEVNVRPGEDAMLPCWGPKDVAVTFLQWSRPDLKSNGFVYFYQEDNYSESYQHPSFRGRVKLKDPQMKNGDVSLILMNVTTSDTGTYECYIIISNTGHSDRSYTELSHLINLRVTDPASHCAAPAPVGDLSLWLIIRHIAVCSPYLISTLLILSIYRQKPTERIVPAAMMTSPTSEGDEGSDEQYYDVIAEDTTEYHF